MGISGEIKQITVADELHACPECGYEYGFHCSFVHINEGKEGKDNPVKSTRDVYRVILICPNCGARFDAGWKIPLTKETPLVVKTVRHLP
jgi:transcription elongation factor Elf1